EAAIAHGLLSLAVKRIWQELGQLLQNHDLTKPSYWVDYDFHEALSDPQTHPKFQQLWRSYQQENPQLLATLPPECPLSFSPALGYLKTNWEGLQG
ncbi:MAG: hypothetical protein VKJ27_01055, partial [Synechocystis sp.]|nr:hypothetical protein [Synechocystis sp.]